MKNEILKFIEERNGGVSFAELELYLDGFKGEKVLSIEGHNIILWGSVSQEAVAAMEELVKTDLIAGRTTSVLTYFCDGKVLNLPLAKQSQRAYKSPHWWPVSFSLTDQGKKALAEKKADSVS